MDAYTADTGAPPTLLPRPTASTLPTRTAELWPTARGSRASSTDRISMGDRCLMMTEGFWQSAIALSMYGCGRARAVGPWRCWCCARPRDRHHPAGYCPAGIVGSRMSLNCL